MKLLLIFLGVVVGIILFLGIVCLILWLKIKKTARSVGMRDIKLKDIFSRAKQLKEEDSFRVRSVSGMTQLLKPNIIRDFPEFNENLLYNMTEDSLRTIFNALSNKDGSELNRLPVIKENICMMIDDYRANNIDVSYRDIKFHDFALKDYTKEDGVATVTVSTSLEFYYTKSVNGEVTVDDRYKKQTRYACKFIYIYDESKVKGSLRVIATNCPNCGATIRNLGHKYCEYCGTAIKEVNLKAWAFSSYEEY